MIFTQMFINWAALAGPLSSYTFTCLAILSGYGALYAGSDPEQITSQMHLFFMGMPEWFTNAWPILFFMAAFEWAAELGYVPRQDLQSLKSGLRSLETLSFIDDKSKRVLPCCGPDCL